MKFVLIVILCLPVYIGTVLYGQSCPMSKASRFWYFGPNLGLDFGTGSPVGIWGSAYSFEGSAVISDVDGNLLFYSEGIHVYNKNGLKMPNGSGLNGIDGSSQSALIVPDPGNSNTYYLFTSDADAGWGSNANGYGGISYTTIDMTLNGGLGDVTVKNVPLLTPASEKLTAVRQCNGKDFWIIGHKYQSTDFYVWPLTAAGVGTPIISSVGFKHTSPAIDNVGAEGYLKASPNGKRLACAMTATLDFQLFDFDDATGVVSNPVTIPGPSTNYGPYGLAFSPDNSKLYISIPNEDGFIGQYDLNATNIAASLAVLSQANEEYYGALQQGLDGKIYVGQLFQNDVGVITDPDKPGLACNFTPHAISLPNSSGIGLPNFPQYYFEQAHPPTAVNLGPDLTNICPGTPITLDAGPCWKNYHWSTGATSQTITVTTGGNYWVDADQGGCTIPVHNDINVTYLAAPAPDLGPDMVLCPGNTTTLTGPAGWTTYNWSPGGAATQNLVVSTTGTYTLTVTTGVCTASDVINVSVETLPQITATATPTVACQNQPVVLSATGASTYSWETLANPGVQIGTGSPVIQQVATVTYLVIGTDNNQCSNTAQVTVTVQYCAEPFDIRIPNIFTPNADGDNDHFTITGHGITSLELTILNRWGNVMYTSTKLDQGWDGTTSNGPASDGVYFYVMHLKTEADGTGTDKKFQGFLTLIR